MKILVVLKDLYTGGIQKSSVNLVNFLSSKGEEVDLLVFNKKGPLFTNLDKNVNVLEINKSLLPFSVSQSDAKNYGLVFWLKRTLLAIRCKIFGNATPLKRALKKQSKVEKNYDLVIASSGSVGTKSMTVGLAEFVLEKTSAKEKWCLVHGDYSKSGLNEPYANSLYAKFDKVLCVSKSCMEVMREHAPESIKNINYLYNVCEVEDVLTKKEEKINSLHCGFNIVSVSRLSEEKGHIRFLKVLNKLHNEGFKFFYTIVGDGSERANIETFITENNMVDYVILTGNKTNPYPYMKAADLFALPSFHEAAPMVFAESFLCGTPVLTTNTVSAKELVGDYGFIVENTEEGIYNSLKELLKNKDLVENKKQQLKNYNYDNEGILTKLKTLME